MGVSAKIRSQRIIFFVESRAHQRLNSPTIPAKLVRTTLTDLKVYFGSSLPRLK